MYSRLMMRLADLDGIDDCAAWARRLGVSVEACELTASAGVLDLHLDTFIWDRIFRYDIAAQHRAGPFDGRFFGHADLPRLRAGGITSAFWSITTNPFRPADNRHRTFLANLDRLRTFFGKTPGVRHVRNMTEYRAARAAGDHAAWITVQGGNALDASPDLVSTIPDSSVCQITLVHLSTSSLGKTSAPDPLGRGKPSGLTRAGKEFVEACDAERILVDLAHIHPDGFWDAVDVHDPSLPLIDTHTGVDGVHLHWRNIDDDQILAIARSGGTIGIIFHCSFLGGSYFGDDSSHRIFSHLRHVVDIAGEDHASLGSDWDGMICTPRDMKTVLEVPVLTQHMLDAGWSDDRITKILSGNALRVLEAIRP